MFDAGSGETKFIPEMNFLSIPLNLSVGIDFDPLYII